VTIAGILLVMVGRFFSDSHQIANIQEQIIERDQNAHFVIKRLSEAMMQAGADLPSTGWPFLEPLQNPAASVGLGVNPRGGIQVISAPMAGIRNIPIDDEKKFAKARYVLIDGRDPFALTQMAAIDVDYSQGGFVNGIKSVSTDRDTLRLTAPVTLAADDVIYAYEVENYRLENGHLMLGGVVLAENIDSLSVTFFGQDQSLTKDWKAMRSVKVSVTARIALPDPRVSPSTGDPHHKLSLSTTVRFRNRM
jgi:hypothetical protein